MDNKFSYFSPNSKLYMVILAIAIVILFCYAPIYIGAVGLGIYSILVIYNILNIRARKIKWKRFVEDFTSNLDSATRSTLINLPFPLIITGVSGNILWYNQNFSKIHQGEELLGKSLSTIIKEIKIKEILNGEGIRFPSVKINEGYYDIYASIVDTEDINDIKDIKSEKDGKDRMLIFYLNDVTKMAQLLKSTEESKEAVVLIEVDNLDEVVKSTEDDKKPLLVAEIERTINSFSQSLNSMSKKYDSNKYVFSVQDKYIIFEEGKKFDILDAIREINIGNKLSVTLSIGVGRHGETPMQNQKFASAAKDLALSRGGDQVVIKTGEKLEFFGGKTKEVEKRTKVRARVLAHALVGLINESSDIFIMGHNNPDIDCIGSAMGIASVIKTLGKHCYITAEGMNSSVKPIYEKIMKDPDYDKLFVDNDFLLNNRDEESLLILVDVHNKSYVQNYAVVKKFDRLVIIDHHRKASDYIENTLISYVEPYASSTSELVTEMLEYMVDKPKLKQIEAETLLAGICVDTKNFSFKTGVRTFEAAAFLRRLGADTIEIKKLFSNNLDSYISRSEIIKNASILSGIAIARAPSKMEDLVIIAQAADELLNISGIQASFVLAKIKSEVFISARSFGEINVQLILESLGGGGHMTIAGAKLSDMSIDSAEERLLESINKYLEEDEKR